ncbi:MAG: ABC transporter permease [Firmicutes bacterium]|nr:ABC transporter permease [Bacillota bacterium]
MSKAVVAPARKYKRKSRFKEIWRRMKKNKLSMVGLCVFALFVAMIIFADLIVPYRIALEQNVWEQFAPPSVEHLLGMDQYGRDIFARVIHGSRNSLLMGIAAVFVGMIIGGTLASLAGYYGGKVDMVIMRISDTIFCIPFMLMGLSIVAALGPGLINVLIAITITAIPNYVRIIRSAILTIVGNDFIEAGRACGASDIFIILKHVAPNAVGPIIVQATMQVGTMIIFSTAFSYLGLGIQPPAPEWGAMLAEGKSYMLSAPHMIIAPGMSIVLVALSLNLLGDGLRDALDPKLKD